MRRQRFVAAAAAVTAMAMALAACGGGEDDSGGDEAPTTSAVEFNAGNTSVVNKSDATGGTVKFAHSDDFDSPDPGNTYYAISWNFGRNFARTLMAFKNAPGAEGKEIVPDLAEAPGEATDEGKTWTFKLKSGLKFEDGSPITSKDIKYAIERSNYAPDVLSNGPTYFKALLGTDYKGPYKDTSPDKLGLTAIETPDDTTLIFRLQQPFGDFNFLATTSQTAPVPAAKDTGDKYATSIVSSGPYKIDSYEPGKSMKLSKNPNWDPATDPNRKQFADNIEITFKMEANDLDNRLLNGDLDIDLAGTGVQAAAQAKVLSTPDLKKNADNPLTGFLRYVAISTTTPPFDNIECRKAVIYAADHEALQTAYGGPTSGDIATTMLPPNIVGYQKTDVLGLAADKNGNVEKAKAALTACGQPNGFNTIISARADRPKEVAGAEALQQALTKVGIKAEIKTFPAGQYFANYAGSTSYVHQNKLGLMFMGWGADWPTGYGFLQQVVDGRAIKASGNTNLSELNDPAINKLFDDSGTADTAGLTKIWGQIDEKVMQNAVIVPIVYEKALLYRNPEVTNVFVHPAYGMYTYTGLGIKQ